MSSFSAQRRGFLRSAAAGLATLAAPSLLWTSATRAQSPESLIKELPYDSEQLRALALRALEAARAAGARFADIRILLTQIFGFSASSLSGMTAPIADTMARVGVRAVFDSTIGFASDALAIDADKFVALAQLAVARSKAGQPRRPRTFEFAPVPTVVNGSWRTPIEIDPFAIPLGEQEALILDALEGVKKIKGAASINSIGSVGWIRKDEIFASTEGSTIQQRFYTSTGTAGSSMRSLHDNSLWVSGGITTYRFGGYGYEAVSKSNLGAEWLKAADKAVRMSTLAVKSVDVGRYDAVFSPEATGHLLVDTIGYPLQLDRALGLVVNTKGTSYLAPPAEVLGKFQLGSRLLNVTADRSRRGSSTTVGWDTEGVKPDDYVLVRDGIPVDYLTTRELAPALRGPYESQGLPIRSRGCAAGSGGERPVISLPNLSLAPGPISIGEDDLMKDIKRGVFIESMGSLSTDQSGLSVQASAAIAYEIIDGKKTRLLRDIALQFTAPQFWRSVDAIGGQQSSVTSSHLTKPFGPEHSGLIAVTAVPIRARKMNVVNIGKKA